MLLELVVVHTQVSTTAAPLTSQMLKYLLEQVSKHLIESFKARARYSLAALMQATLDVEFLAQTLGNYTTDKASEVQSAIYIALDERTDNDARVKLQTELGELRVVLKKLREATKSELWVFFPLPPFLSFANILVAVLALSARGLTQSRRGRLRDRSLWFSDFFFWEWMQGVGSGGSVM